ncbi:MAG: hypothetical protein AAF432_08655, partial [Planctomycetota bacterium]
SYGDEGDAEVQSLESYDFGDFTFSGSNIKTVTKSVQVQTGATAADNIDMEYTLVWDTDPFVVNVFSMTNNTGIGQVFTIDATAFVNPALMNGTSHRGQVSGSTTDADQDGLGGVEIPAGANLYEAFVDGASSRTMGAGFQSFGFGGAGDTAALPSLDFGPEAGPLNAMTDIKLTYTFYLEAGDSISLNGFYFIESDPIPAPAALGLLGVAGLAARRRRRA